MVAVGSILRILGGGLYFYGFSVFFLPLSQDLGLNRAATSLVFSLARAQGAFEGPIAGYFMDRHGPRPLMIMALLMTGVGHMLLSGVNSYVTLLLVYMGVVSLSFHAGFMDAPMLIANTWFIRNRTMAMAIISGSIGIGGFIFTPILSAAVHAFGWRQAAFGCGVAFLVIGIPLALLVWKGLDQQRAAVFLAAQAFMAVPSHLLFGWIGDRLNKPRLMAACMLLATLSMILLLQAKSELAILLFTALFSVVESTFPVNWSTVGEYFGRKNFAKIRGSMSFVSTWGSVFGPVIAGVIYDHTRSYEILIWSSAALLLVASLLYALVKKPARAVVTA